MLPGKPYVVINMPPRVGKTKMMEALCCWMFAYFPESQIIYTSYSNAMASESSRYIQQVMAAPWYVTLFGTRLGKIQQADRFTTNAGGNLFADGTAGSLAGIGAGLKREAGGFIIVDDPSKPDEAMSTVEMEKIRFWLENTIVRRRNSSEFTPIIVCAHRIAIDDLPGHILEKYPGRTVHLKFPGFVDGKSIIPETITTEAMMDTQEGNPFAFSAQIQQEPVVWGGNLIKTDDFPEYDPGQPMRFDRKLITVDTAMKAKQHSDFTVMQCWGKIGKNIYLIDQMRGKWLSPELITYGKEFRAKHHLPGQWVGRFLIEEANVGEAMIQQMRREGVPVEGIVIPQRDKVARVKEVLPFIVTHRVHLPKGAPWLPGFKTECAQFREDGKQKHDDQIDAMVYGIQFLLGRPLSILDVIRDRQNPQAA